MNRIDNIFKSSLIALFLVILGVQANAQTTDALGTYTPYSLFGLGDIDKQGTSFNRGMMYPVCLYLPNRIGNTEYKYPTHL